MTFHPLTDAAILAVIDQLRIDGPEMSGIRLVRAWSIPTITSASSGVVAGYKAHRNAYDAALATAETVFHVKPLNFGNRLLGALLAHLLLINNGEEKSFADTVELIATSK